MKQGFKPKSINDIEVGMKVLFSSLGKLRGTVKYVGPVCGLGLVVGIVLDPGDKSGKVRELKLLKRRYIDCCKYQLYFVQKSYFMRTI